MASAEPVERLEQGSRRQFFTVDGNRVSLIKGDFDHLGGIRSLLGRYAQRKHLRGGRLPGIFQHAAFITDMEEVPVGAVRFFLGRRYRDAVFFCKRHQHGSRIQIPFPPGGDDFYLGIQRQVAQLKTDLIVAFAGGAVTDGIRPFAVGDFDLTLCNQRPGKRGSKQILPLIDGIGPKGRKNKIFYKGLFKIVDIHLCRAGLKRFFLNGVEFFFLAEIG